MAETKTKSTNKKITLFKKLMDARSEIPTIKKTGVGQVGHRKYQYAQRDDILAVVEPILKTHGLGLFFKINQEVLPTGDLLTQANCFIYDEDGELLESGWVGASVSSNSRNQIQDVGAIETYAERYALRCVLGLETGDDIDGQGIEKLTSTITNDQATQIKKGIQEYAKRHDKATEEVESSLLQHYSVSSVNALQKNMFKDVVARLKS